MAKIVFKPNCRVAHWCPACKEMHDLAIEGCGGPTWTYNGNPDQPTFWPSVAHRQNWRFDPKKGKDVPSDDHLVCHYFITNGQIQYCDDCPHELCGQTVPMPDIPETKNDNCP